MRRRRSIDLYGTTKFYCGDGLCTCDSERADCEGSSLKGPKVRYIPALPSFITELSMSWNNLTSSMVTKEFFTNASTVKKLILDCNNMSDLQADVFDLMPNLEFLFMSENKKFTAKTVRYLLSIPSLKYLGLNSNSIERLPVSSFLGVDSNVTKLILRQNAMSDIDMDVFAPLKKLYDLDLSKNFLREMRVTKTLKLIRLLVVANFLQRFPETCQSNNVWPLFPQLRILWLQENRIEKLPRAICLPMLQELDLTRNKLVVVSPQTFSDANFTRLKKLSMGWTNQVVLLPHEHRGWLTIHENAFSSSSLRKLDLSNNDLNFADLKSFPLLISEVNEHAFANCTELRDLTLDNNLFRFVTKKRFHALFGHLKLTDLSMRNCQMETLQMVTESGLTTLERLVLRDNMISSIPDKASDSMLSLQYLDLSGNAISVISETTFSQQILGQLDKLYVGSNPFNCGCDLLWFQKTLTIHHCKFYEGNTGPGFTSVTLYE
jgi:Leucine-rich repeat (LRR) protein